jgi:peptidoglycan-associated lipoprotein
MKTIQTSLFTLIAAAVLGGCSSTPVAPQATSTASPPSAPAMPKPGAGATAAPSSTVATVVIPPHKDPKSPISTERSVYFDYDDFSVKSDYGAVVERQGRYLQASPSLSIRIEGSADERGSAEYNLALGTRRANSVRDYLVSLGIATTRMTVVSKGKEAPVCKEENEACWQQNRRGHFVITAK